jgi:hypothetical protein
MAETDPGDRDTGGSKAIADVYQGKDLNHEGHEEHEGKKG